MYLVRSTLVLSVVIAASLAACNAVTGVDDLTFDRTAQSSATGGTSSANGGSSGLGGGFGVGGAGMCSLMGTVPQDSCTMCLQGSCCMETKDCLADQQCAPCAIASNCPAQAQWDAATSRLFLCIELHCAVPCAAKVGEGAGGSPTTMGVGPGPGAGGTGSSTVGGGPMCSSMPRAVCANCCSNMVPGGQNAFVALAETCSCEQTNFGSCLGPAQCGDPTTCNSKALEQGCLGCPDFQQCVSDSCFVDDPCGEYVQCISTCP